MTIVLSIAEGYWSSGMNQTERIECCRYVCQDVRSRLGFSAVFIWNDNQESFLRVVASPEEIRSGLVEYAMSLVRSSWVRYCADLRFFGVGGVSGQRDRNQNAL